MHKLTKEQSVYSFDKNHNPVLHIESGEKVLFETFDCFSNQIENETQLVTSLDYSRVNPATGPVYINGTEPGHTLKVSIDDIRVRDWGVICTLPNIGILVHTCEPTTKIVSVENNERVTFNEDIQFNAKPMIGVMGCAPAGDGISNMYPGDHGGNMDNHIITKGSHVYLPVNVPGALFSLGDIHASMGDGEICGTGVEIAGEVEATFSVIKNQTLQRPLVETDESWYTVASHTSTDRAIQIACEDMQNLLVEKWGLSLADAYLLMSVTGDVQMCQCCKAKPDDNLEVIARFKMPKLDNMPRLIE